MKKFYKTFSLFAAVFACSIIVVESALARVDPVSTDVDFGAFIGNLLPNQVEGVTEITPQWGLRTSLNASGGFFYYEFSGTAGKGSGAEWSSLNLSFRMDMQLETITGFVFFGGDVTRFKGETTEFKTFGGGHVGGGVLSHIGDALWFRTEMKFNVNPGTSLFINGGFVFRFGGSSSKK